MKLKSVVFEKKRTRQKSRQRLRLGSWIERCFFLLMQKKNRKTNERF